MSSSPIEPVERIQRNLLAVGERRLLTWLSARLPGWVTPDKLTSLGFLGAVMVGAGYALSALDPAWLWLSIVSFFINWFGDSLDGSLARFRHIERPRYGYFIDHSMDAIGNLIIMIGIGISPFVRMDVALIGLAVYFLLSIHTFLSAKVAGEFNLTYLAGGPTELRLILIAMSLAMFWGGAIPAGDSIFTVFDVFILVLASILMIVFLVQTAAMAARLRRLGQ